MVRDDLHITVPSYFRCPISLEVMKSPVSLCTGVTYDRSSIQLWLDSGNNTCPATMQVLKSKDLVPNHTLHRLIQIWLASVPTRSTNSASLSDDSVAHRRVSELVLQLKTYLQKPFSHLLLINQNLSRLVSFAAEKEGNGKVVAMAGGQLLPLLVPLFSKLKDLNLLEKIVLFCNVLLKNRAKIDSEGSRLSSIEMGNRDFKKSVLICLKQGRLQLRIAVVKFLELMATHLVFEEDDEIYSELLRLIVSPNQDPEALEVSLSFLIRLNTPKRNRVKMVKAGGIKILSKLLSEAELNPPLTEKALKLIEMASSCKEGRTKICEDEMCIKAVVKKMLKVSNMATEHAVTVLWSLCCLFRENTAATAAAVAESNGMAKILVLLQSNCSPAVRQMCGELLRTFRCNAKTTRLSCYDTKTTHIMPF